MFKIDHPVSVLKWIEDEKEDSRAPAWFHHETVEMKIGRNLEETF